MDKLLAMSLPQAPAGVPKGGLSFLNKVLANGLNMLMIVAVMLSLVFLVWGGIQWISSSGDKNKLTAARNRITWAIIGLVITFLTFFIINVIGGLFGVKLTGK